MRVLILTCILSLVCSQLEAQTTGENVEAPAEEGNVPNAEESAESAPEEGAEPAPEEGAEPEAEEEPAPEEGAEPEAEEELESAEGEEEESYDEDEESYDEDEEDSFYDEEGEMFDDEEGSSGRDQIFLIGPGFGLGFFFKPDSINDYIEDWQTIIGKSDADYKPMLLSYVPRVVFNFVPIEYVQPQVLFEVGISPKIAKKESGQKTFHLIRGSIGGLLNFHLPIREKYSAFIGGGAFLHVMKFDERGATDWGFRGQMGFRFYKGVVVPEVFVAFDHIKTSDISETPEVDSEDSEEAEFKNRGVEFDLTGITIGVNVLFNAT
ncbi:MAG: hypothetical protein GY854_25680 [Deltaproteobacteria bacterium]|nr:hypothetical protein [Deltaproteobacteria bacterium]